MLLRFTKLIFTWHVTARVWHSCVLPVLNSPNISVMEPVSIPPCNSLSNSFEPERTIGFMFKSRYEMRVQSRYNTFKLKFACRQKYGGTKPDTHYPYRAKQAAQTPKMETIILMPWIMEDWLDCYLIIFSLFWETKKSFSYLIKLLFQPTCCDLDDFRPLLMKLSCCRETHWH